MAFLTPGMRSAIRQNKAFFVFEMVIDGTTYRYGRNPVKSDSLGFYEDRVESFGTITREVGLKAGGISAVETSVTLLDHDSALSKIAEGSAARDILGSVARLRLVAEDVDTSDFWTAFTGVIKGYYLQSPYRWVFRVGTDDRPLRGKAYHPPLTEYDFPNVADDVRDTSSQIIYGVHNDSGLTTGLVVCPLVDDTNYVYHVSYGWIDDVTKIYQDGSVLVGTPTFSATGASDWTYASRNGRRYTELTLSGQGLDGSEVITVNCKGLTDSGDGSQGGGSGTLIENSARQLENYLSNFVFNRWQSGTWYTAASASVPLSEAGLTKAAAYFDTRGRKASRVIEGGQTGLARLNEWSEQHQVPSFWIPDGEISFAPDDYFVENLYLDWPLFIQNEQIVGGFSYSYDTSGMLDEVSAKYMWGQATESFFRTTRVKDTTQGLDVAEELEMRWGRSSLT